jgi:hypothetical protein
MNTKGGNKMENKTYPYTENYEDVNAPAFPDSRFVHISKFNIAMFFAIGEIVEIVNTEKEIGYDDLKELTRQRWLDDEPEIPIDMYPAVFEKAYKYLLESHIIREEIRDIAGVETRYVLLNKLPFFEDLKQTLRFFFFTFKLYFGKNDTKMNKEVKQ